MPIWGAFLDPNSVDTAQIKDAAVTLAKIAAGVLQYQTIKDPSGVAQTQRSVLKFTGAGIASVSDVAGETVVDVSSGGTPFYQTVQDSGTPETQRNNLNFIGFTVADNSGNDSTDITAPTDTDHYQTVQDGGSDQTQRDKLNFVGCTVSDSASPSRTTVEPKTLSSLVTAAGTGSSNAVANNSETVRITQAFTTVADVALMLSVNTGTYELRPQADTDGVLIEVRLYVDSTLVGVFSLGGFKGTNGANVPRTFGGGAITALVGGLSAGSHTIEVRDIGLSLTNTMQMYYRGDLQPALLQILDLIR